MAGPQLDASLRRATLLAEARGFVVPDSKPALEPAPQIIIEGDDEDIFLDFSDGLGYTTDKNTYKNFGYKFIWAHSGKVQDSASAQSVTDDLDEGGSPGGGGEGAVPVFNEETGKYEAVPLVGAAVITIERPANRTYILVLELPFDITITDTSDDISAGPYSIVYPSGDILAGNPLEVVVSSTNSLSSYLTIQVNFEYRL